MQDYDFAGCRIVGLRYRNIVGCIMWDFGNAVLWDCGTTGLQDWGIAELQVCRITGCGVVGYIVLSMRDCGMRHGRYAGLRECLAPITDKSYHHVEKREGGDPTLVFSCTSLKTLFGIQRQCYTILQIATL